MAGPEEIWFPLVDEPIGSIVEQLQAEDPEIDKLVDSPRKLLAFRTFAYIRVGILLGRLLVDNDVPAYDGTETWVEALLREPFGYHEAILWSEFHCVEVLQSFLELVPNDFILQRMKVD